MHGEQFDYTAMGGPPSRPNPVPAPSPAPAPPRRRPPVMLLGCGAAFLFFVLILGFIGGIGALIMTSMKSSDLYKEAVDRACNHLEVINSLGQPIEAGWLVMGSISSSGTDQDVKLTVPLHGPNASATLYIEGQRRAGVVGYRELAVVVKGSGSRINLLPE